MEVKTLGKETYVRATTVDKEGKYRIVEIGPNDADDGTVDVLIDGERL